MTGWAKRVAGWCKAMSMVICILIPELPFRYVGKDVWSRYRQRPCWRLRGQCCWGTVEIGWYSVELFPAPNCVIDNTG